MRRLRRGAGFFCCALLVNANRRTAAETRSIMMDTVSQIRAYNGSSQCSILDSFLKAHQDGILRIQKPVKLEHVGALVGAG